MFSCFIRHAYHKHVFVFKFRSISDLSIGTSTDLPTSDEESEDIMNEITRNPLPQEWICIDTDESVSCETLGSSQNQRSDVHTLDEEDEDSVSETIQHKPPQQEFHDTMKETTQHSPPRQEQVHMDYQQGNIDECGPDPKLVPDRRSQTENWALISEGTCHTEQGATQGDILSTNSAIKSLSTFVMEH